MMRIKVFGAGSIGNHLAHAARTLGWQVVVCDISEDALARMQDEIYPARYGQWDQDIQLFHCDSAPKGDFDVIVIGTPPDVHMELCLEALDENPTGVLVEKPLCTPSLERVDELMEARKKSTSRIFVGYDHVVGRAVKRAEEALASGEIGEPVTLDVEFREHWQGIFNAHPWLNGPQDSYLGYWRRGGGAGGEHSHALNLWQHFAQVLGFGRVGEVSACIHYETDGKATYDSLFLLNLKTENGFVGRVVQDVVTSPPVKRVVIQGSKGVLEVVIGYSSSSDAVILRRAGQSPQIKELEKTRPDDFREELKHISQAIADSAPSPLDIGRGLDTMLVIAAAHRSQVCGRRMHLDYGCGCNSAAIFG